MADAPDKPVSPRPAGRKVAEITLRRLQTEITQGHVEVYRNVFEQPFVIFRIEGRPQGSHPLRTDFVRGWLADFAWQENIGLLREREIDRVLMVLSGHALKNNRPQIEDAALLDVLRSVPVVVVVYEYMLGQQVPTMELQAKPLHKALMEFAQERGLQQLGRKRFPAGPNWLSHELRHYKAVLAALGVDVVIWRSNGCNVRLSRRSDDSSQQPSTEPSAGNVVADNQLQTLDAKNAQLARLRARKACRQRDEGKGESR